MKSSDIIIYKKEVIMSDLNFKVDENKCIHCGKCEADCEIKIISLNADKIPVIKKEDEESCMKCQHCFAICPVGAISICNKDPQNSPDCSNLPSDEQVLNLIKHRRSIRKYRHENLDKETIQKLKDMLKYSPTGCNNHKLHIAIIDDVEMMDKFRNRTNNIIKKIMLSDKLTPITKNFGKFRQAFIDGKDVIFRNAPHMIVVSVPVTAPCAPIDPVILLSYFELYAQSLGIGTLWCGFAEIAIKLIPELCEYLEIPDGYKVGYVMLFGPTDLKYSRTTQPEDYQITTVTPKENLKISLTDKLKRYFWNSLR